MKIVVYTCIVGDKDNLKIQPYEEGVKYIVFSDSDLETHTWEVKKTNFHRTNRRTARKYKVLAHKYFPKVDYTIWVDGSILLKHKPSYYIHNYLHNSWLACRPHHRRDCIYQEALQIKKLNYENENIITTWTNKLINEEYPKRNGLAETGLLIRKNNSEAKIFNETWWDLIEQYSARDQLTFDFVHWMNGTSYAKIDGQDVEKEPHKIPTSMAQ